MYQITTMNIYSSIFMLVGSTFFLFLFGLPLLISPMTWARVVGWKLPEERNLATYLGRSLGGLILAVIVMSYLAAMNPWEYRFVFDMVILIGIFQVIVHVYGFIKKNQPLIEHLEIVLYALLSFLAWLLYPKPPA